MAKATITMKQALGYQAVHAAWFTATQALFNQVAAFYFEVIQAHPHVLHLSNKDALTALEKLTQKAGGVSGSQVAKRRRKPSTSQARHGAGNAQGTAQDTSAGMAADASGIPHPLRLFNE